MANSYKFALIRYTSDDARDERLNIGAIVMNGCKCEVYIGKKLDKVHAISGNADVEKLRELSLGLADLDKEVLSTGLLEPEDRLNALKAYGPLSLSNSGEFTAESKTAYRDRITSILKYWVDPETAPKREREKRSRLATQIKREFSKRHILADTDETLDAHRVVRRLQIDAGIVADFALKNGTLNIVETVDVMHEEEGNKAFNSISKASFVLESARHKFTNEKTNRKLIYRTLLEKIAQSSLKVVQDQGAQLVNWDSQDDQRNFLTTFGTLAHPKPKHSKKSQSPRFL